MFCFYNANVTSRTRWSKTFLCVCTCASCMANTAHKCTTQASDCLTITTFNYCIVLCLCVAVGIVQKLPYASHVLFSRNPPWRR